ncbi:toxin-antitoxin system, toxin component [Streptomyces sp. NEAU-sy36]|uniref:toxin-antitoxin system, toxin component n=1 Tax=unclassified Streptomyces TaxID=2593676 RepID=UPI0015D63309|nr:MULTISPECIES: toxin-antitoxin system, toxin component [unclassified Streptomyces]QLJ00692.1 toxin-antitoxin system, toxin component [Streptomyces sp. NEAU-sy36]
MSAGTRAMRRLGSRLFAALDVPGGDDTLLPAVGRAVTQVRGRPVRLHAVAFPPELASGLWIDRAGQDVIAYERNTDLDHQLVIIGHEVWHMFEGHCGSLTAHGPAASRALGDGMPDALRDLVAGVCDEGGDGSAATPGERMDLGFHIALRADDPAVVRQEEEAEFFGYRFATGVREALAEARSLADPERLEGRIRVSLVHRIRGC